MAVGLGSSSRARGRCDPDPMPYLGNCFTSQISPWEAGAFPSLSEASPPSQSALPGLFHPFHTLNPLLNSFGKEHLLLIHHTMLLLSLHPFPFTFCFWRMCSHTFPKWIPPSEFLLLGQVGFRDILCSR